MLVAFDRMEMEEEVFKNNFRTVHIIIWIIVPENGPHKIPWKIG